MAFLSGGPDDLNLGAPIDFQISSSSSGSESGHIEIRSLYGEKCPLCCKIKKHFLCKDCLISGDFWHSSSNGDIRERYRELKLHLQKKQEERDQLAKQCTELTMAQERALQLVEEIDKYQRVVEIQKLLKNELQRKLSASKQTGDLVKKQNDEKKRIWPLYKSRLNNMEQQTKKMDRDLQKKNSHLLLRKKHLQNVSKSRIIELKNCVFPIQEVYANPNYCRALYDRLEASNVTLTSSNDGWSDEEDDTVRSLMAATSKKGGGGYSPSELSSTFGLGHSIAGILGPSLPISGDYSAYNNLVESGQSATSSYRNPAHVIAAGLTFLTQFVNMISYYLDLRLPHRLSYSEFSMGCLQSRKFNRKVAKLNANVIHLCASQGIPPSYLHPRKTISNILLLFDPTITGFCDLGRRGPFEVGIQLARSMEESIEKDLVIYEDGDSESDTDCGDMNFPSDWETVHRGSVTEEMAQLETMTRYQQSYVQSGFGSDSFIRSRNTTSITGNLVSSVTSFFRGWNN